MINFKIRSQGGRLILSRDTRYPDCEIFLTQDGEGENKCVTVCARYAGLSLNRDSYIRLLRFKPNGFVYRCKNVSPFFKVDEQGKLRFSTVPYSEEV